MKIVIGYRHTYNNDTALSVYTSEFWRDMAALKPNHTFIFLTDGKNTAEQLPGMAVKKLKPTGFKWYDQQKLNRTLIALQADRFITNLPAGFSICHPARTDKKQKDIVWPDRQVLFIGNGNEQTQNEILLRTVTCIIPAHRHTVNEMSWAEAESIRTQYTGGRSFFLFAGDISEQHQLLDLLKAFSSFKKWQQSNMQLVIAGYSSPWTPVFEEKLLTYKYRADIVMVKNTTSIEMAKLTAAAYTLVYPCADSFFSPALLWAVQSGKAVIATGTLINRQVTQFAEWVDENDTAEGFAKAMKLLYKDEKHQQQLQQQIKMQSKQYHRGQMLAGVWACIEK